MGEHFISLPGMVTKPEQLKIPKARSLALALDRELIEYALLVECRMIDGAEGIIFDAEIEVPQRRIHSIQEVDWTLDKRAATAGQPFAIGGIVSTIE